MFAYADATGADSAIFEITDTRLYVPIVTLSTEDNAKLWKLLSKGFKRTVYCNKYEVIGNNIVKRAANNEEKYIRELLILAVKDLKDCLFLLIITKKVIIKSLLLLLKNIFFK